MAITTAKTVANVLARGGSVFVSDDDGTTYYDLGRQKGAQIEFTPVETEPDTAGRTVQLAADVVCTTVLTQTGDTEFVNLDDLVAQATNGLWIKYTDEFTDAAGADAAGGFLFKNAFPVFSGLIKFDNSESSFTMTFKGRVSMATLAAAGAAGNIIAFDA
jgi:hypothetical protein